MPVEWNAHRFSGGALALSAVNSVLYRGDAARTVDRFDDCGELPRFAEAATQHCAEEFAGAVIGATGSMAEREAVISMREAIDRLFRRQARNGCFSSHVLSALLAACAGALAQAGVVLSGSGIAPARPGAPIGLAAAMAVSALALLRPENASRIKVCPNCQWLFVDRSRNASRLWCDMAVCGNRAKARRHYRRRKTDAPAREDRK